MRAALAFAVGAAVVLGADPAAGQTSFDYGDAPDGASAGYAERPKVRGKFPSRARSSGPRHPSSGPTIGAWSGEADSRQVDDDDDDGASLRPRACKTSTLTVAVDASRTDPSATLYANAWFDWNQDGDWADGGSRRCGPEWAIQNVVIDPTTLGDEREALITLRFRAGRIPKQFWWRVQLHAGSPVPHEAGGGQSQPTSGGETEDWFFTRRRVPKTNVELACIPSYDVMEHGEALEFEYRFIGANSKTRLSVRRTRDRLRGETDGLGFIRKEVEPHRAWRVLVTSTQKHEREPFFIQEARIHLDVEALLNGQLRSYTETCYFVVVHALKVELDSPPPSVLTPALKVRVDRVRPDPATAGCGLAFFPPLPPDPRTLIWASCDRVDLKTLSIAAENQQGQLFTGWQSDGDCMPVNDFSDPENPRHAALRCIHATPNRGKTLETIYTLKTNPPVRIRIHILAGGRQSKEGTTIVLLRDYLFTREGVRCSQSIPTAPECTD